MWRYLIFIIISLFANVASAQTTLDFGRYHALLFGNDDYEYLHDLKTAVADAEALARILNEEYGFEVTLHPNANRQTIINAFNQLTNKLTEKDNLLIYYAGHGTLDKYTNTGYWQPVDAQPNLDTFWIPTTDISRYLTRMNAKHVLIIADSCYSGALLTRGEASQLPVGEEPATWLRRMVEQRSRTALTSGWLEPVQDSGSGGHSVFANVLLDILRNNKKILDGHSLFERLKRPVTIRATSDQMPQYADIKSHKHEGGDFLLVPENLQNSVASVKSPDLPDRLFRGESHSGNIPNPSLELKNMLRDEVRGKKFKRYYLSVSNWDAFPEELFEPAPDLPPCGKNANASRTWVHIYSADDDRRLYGFCGFSSSQSLKDLWFAVEEGKTAPSSVYAVLKDRRSDTTYRSNIVKLDTDKSKLSSPSSLKINQ